MLEIPVSRQLDCTQSADRPIYEEVTTGQVYRWQRMRAEQSFVSYLIVQVVDLQLVAPSTVGEVETAVFFTREQLRVMMLFKECGEVNEFHRGFFFIFFIFTAIKSWQWYFKAFLFLSFCQTFQHFFSCVLTVSEERLRTLSWPSLCYSTCTSELYQQIYWTIKFLRANSLQRPFIDPESIWTCANNIIM